MNGDSVNPVQVEQYLGGVDYPATRNDLVDKARQEGADESVIGMLEKLPDQQFNSPVDVTQALGNQGGTGMGMG